MRGTRKNERALIPGATQQIVGRERRERVSQLTWFGGGALIRAAASTQSLDCFRYVKV